MFDEQVAQPVKALQFKHVVLSVENSNPGLHSIQVSVVEHCAQLGTLHVMQLLPSEFFTNPELQVPQKSKLEHEAQLGILHETQVPEMRVVVSEHEHTLLVRVKEALHCEHTPVFVLQFTQYSVQLAPTFTTLSSLVSNPHMVTAHKLKNKRF